MVSSWNGWCLRLGLASLLAMGGAIAASGNCALAQITPDGTLGAESSIVTPKDNINGFPSDQIDGGAKRGANLFHSFREFNIDEGRGAYFTNPNGIGNILSRVTGNDPSKILGRLGVLGNANLFLINPKGIIFGENASLDIGGSFVATTANAIGFGNQGFFSALAPDIPPVLTVNPDAFFFNQIAAGPITVNSGRFTGVYALFYSYPRIYEGLKVPDGQSLLLLGGNVSLDEGVLQAPGGRVELGGLAGAGTVGLKIDSNNLSLSFPDTVVRADVSLSNGSLVHLNAKSSGSLVVNARNIDILGSSFLAGTTLNYGTESNRQAGDITLNATEMITISQRSDISNDVGYGANGGDLNIKAGSLLITNSIISTSNAAYKQAVNSGNISVQVNGDVSFVDSSIFNAAYGLGDAGNILVQANGNVSFVDSSIYNRSNSYIDRGSQIGPGAGSVLVQANGDVSFVDSSIFGDTRGKGDGGNISVQTNGDVSLVDDSQLVVNTYGQGMGGEINIQARSVYITDGSEVLATTRGSGNGGEINIQARSVYITDGSEVLATTDGSGKAGNIRVDAIDSVTLSGVSVGGYSSGLFTATNDDASGQGGEITVRTGALRILDGAVLSARTRGSGDGGNITVNVNTLEVTGGGQMLTTAYSNGNAGSITVNATDSITLSGSDPTYFDRLAKFGGYTVDPASPLSGLFANTSGQSRGQGGSLRIEAGRLNVQDGAEVNVSSAGAGAAGSLAASAGSIRLDNQSSIRATTAAGNQGNITLRSGDLVLRRGSTITTNATGSATGGNITIDTGVLAALENSDISADADAARGGRVIINAQGIFGTQFRTQQTPESDITASSDLGPEFSGIVEINTPDVDPRRGLVNLPAELVQASGLIATGCSAVGENKFIITGRGGLPENPTDPLSSDAIEVDLVTLNPREENRSSPRQSPQRGKNTQGAGSTVSTHPTNSAPAPLVEATGWVTNDKGEVVLVATAPTVTPHIPWMTPASCHGS